MLDCAPAPADLREQAAFRYVHGAIEDGDALNRAFEGVDRCVHLAGASVTVDPRGQAADKIDAFAAGHGRLFDAAVAAGTAVVYASSAAVYGETSGGLIDEDAPTRPVNAHGMDKLAAERTARQNFDRHGLPSIGLRMFNVYGAGQSVRSPYCGVVRLFADRILNGGTAKIFAGGRQVRDFLYIDDAVRFLKTVVEAPLAGAGVVNVCSGIGVTVLDVVRALERATGRKLAVEAVPAGGGVTSSVGNPAKARTLYGFAAETDFDTGVHLVVQALTAGRTDA